MKTVTREYTDGTEPDVIARWCCDGLCDQGRDCPVKPAEAATEIGQEEPDFYSRELILKEAAEFAISVLVIFAVVGAIAAFVGYFV
jgi:hypothetical protein